MSQHQLAKAIIALSAATSWDEAKLEWALEEVYRQNEPDTCLCGHYPIVEICVLRNKRNGRTAEVGNVCVKKFLGLPSDKIFQAIRRVSTDEERALNIEAIEHAYQRGWITAWERNFSIDTMRKRKLTERQMAVRIRINERVLERTHRARGGIAT